MEKDIDASMVLMKLSKLGLRIGTALLFLTFAAPSSVCADGTPPPGMIPPPAHLKGIILTPEGKPAADATIFYTLVDMSTHTVSSEKTLHSTASGAFDILWAWNPKDFQLPVLYITAPEGVAVPTIDTKEMKITLSPATSVRVHFLDEAGKPVAQVRVCPAGFLQDRHYTAWNEAVQDHLSAVTDETGTVTLTGLPQGYSMRLDVVDTRYVQPAWDQNILLSPAAALEATVHVAHGGSLSGTVVFGPTKLPAAHLSLSAVPVVNGPARQDAVTDAQGVYQIANLPPGNYTVSVERADALSEWTAVQQSATVSMGSTTEGVDFTLIHGSTLTGVITEPKTGKPVPKVAVLVIGPAGDQYLETDAQGRYTLHVPPGNQLIMLLESPGITPTEPQRVALAEGETKTVNFQSTPPVRPAVVRGIVIGPHGKPVVGAVVTAAAQSQQEMDTKQTTDVQGRFTFGSPAPGFSDPGLTPDMRLYATADGLATPVGTLAASAKPLTLRLAAQAEVVVHGRIVDPAGRAISGAKAMLFRQNTVGFGGTGIDTVTTDAAGRYRFTPAVPEATYSVGVSAQGFGYEFTPQAKSTPGKLLAFAPLTLPYADSFVGGTVVDLNGQPIAGADVSLTSANDVHTLTDAHGKFHLAGATRGKAIVEVQAAQGRFASIQVTSGRDDTVITAKSEDEQTAESKRFGVLLAADSTNHGDGTQAAVLLRAACAQARQSSKKVLLVFHASWCGPCFLLHRFLNDPLVKPVIEAHFITQDIDIWESKTTKGWENPGGDGLYRHYGGLRHPKTPQNAEEMQGVPFFAVLDASGRKLGDARMNGDNIGFPYDSGTTDFFLKTLKIAAPDMTDAELSTLRDGLRRDAKI